MAQPVGFEHELTDGFRPRLTAVVDPALQHTRNTTVIDLAVAEKRLAERRRRREQVLYELETARARRRRRGLRSV